MLLELIMIIHNTPAGAMYVLCRAVSPCKAKEALLLASLSKSALAAGNMSHPLVEGKMSKS